MVVFNFDKKDRAKFQTFYVEIFYSRWPKLGSLTMDTDCVDFEDYVNDKFNLLIIHKNIKGLFFGAVISEYTINTIDMAKTKAKSHVNVLYDIDKPIDVKSIAQLKVKGWI